MAVSKVVKSNGDVIMDISQDNVNANNLLQGGTAHGSDGEAVQGAVIVAPTDVTEVSDTTPYIYKSSEHDAVYDELVGGSVAWNQLVQNGNFESTSGWTGRYSTISVSNNICTVTPSSAGTLRGLIGSETTETVSQNHKLLLSVYILSPITTNVGLSLNGNNQKTISVTANVWKKCECVWTDNVDTAKRLYALIIDNLTTSQIIQYKNALIIDLTQMFGTTIADYVYSLEQSTAGSGIAWLKSYGFLTKDYYPYNAGGLVSVNTSGKKVVSETTEISYPIQSTDLRGLYKLNGTKLYTDGDIYSADGQITRKYGIVDLGTLDWSMTTNNRFYANVEQGSTGIITNALCTNYVVTNTAFSNLQDKEMNYGQPVASAGWRAVAVRDSAYTDAATFKSAMSGVYLIYEFATPTTAPAPPFTSPQMVYRNGTEEYLDTRDVPMPVGGNRKYVDIPEWMVNEYFDDVRGATSTLKTISKLQQENEVLRNALSETTYIIPEGVTEIVETTITDRKRPYVYIPRSVISIGTNGFYDCPYLLQVTLPNSVTSIGQQAFRNCPNLGIITIPNSVTSIGIKAFSECYSLEGISIPSSVTSIGNNAFQYCDNLSIISINKPQNSISGAPWGAPSATVYWNT